MAIEEKPIKTISKRIVTVRMGLDAGNPSEKINESKKPSWFVNSFNEFCNATALHGYSYIVKKNTALWERIAWAIIVLCALIASVVLLWISWKWNAATPTITVIENTHFATWNIPFPAVTICNMNKISAISAQRVAHEMLRPENISTDRLSQMFKYILHFEGIGQASASDYMELDNILRNNNISVVQLLNLIRPKCSDMLLRCMWKGTQTRCDNLFQNVNTTEGVCCSFNNHALKLNNFPEKLVHSIPRLPRKVTACGYQTGLTVLAKPFVKDYHSTFLASTGFRVFIHNSYDYADDNAETKYVTALSEAYITLAPESTYSTSAIRRMPIAERDCFFSDEVKMNVLQSYTYNNCMTECRSNLILTVCGCIPYNYPNNGSVPTCEMSKMSCVDQYKSVFNAALPGTNFSEATLKDTACNCLPDCELKQYFSEVTSGRLNREFSYNSMSFFKDIVLQDETLIHVYFNDLVSTLYRRDLYQNWLSTLASFGGLLGLLLGFSFVTGFELIYFFTLRPFFDHLKSRKIAQQTKQVSPAW